MLLYRLSFFIWQGNFLRDVINTNVMSWILIMRCNMMKWNRIVGQRPTKAESGNCQWQRLTLLLFADQQRPGYILGFVRTRTGAIDDHNAIVGRRPTNCKTEILFLMNDPLWPLYPIYNSHQFNWLPVLQNDYHKQIPIEAFQHRVVLKQVSIYAFVIMPNHFHASGSCMMA